MRYICYYRVSTAKQGRSGLGLEAQQAMIKSFIRPEDEIIFSFTEVESRKKNNRPELKKAIQACKETKSTLLMSHISRLTGNAGFYFQLRDSGLPLKFAEMPGADQFFVGMMALVAEKEHEYIVARVKGAMAAKKARNEPMGKPENFSNESRKKGNRVMKNRFVERVNSIKFALDYLIKQEKKDGEIISTIQGMYKDCPESFVRRAIKYVKSLDETPTLAQ